MRLFSKTELKIIGLSVAAVTVIAVVITIAVGASRNRRQPVARESASTPVELPYTTDLIIPEEFTLTGGERWYFSREPLKAWSKEQVDIYWVDPAETSIELLEGKADTIVKEFVKTLP